MREVWEGVFHSWELLRGAHEGGQVVGSGLREEGWGEITLAPAVSRPRSRRSGTVWGDRLRRAGECVGHEHHASSVAVSFMPQRTAEREHRDGGLTPSCTRTSRGCGASGVAPSRAGGGRWPGTASRPPGHRSSRPGSVSGGRRRRARSAGYFSRDFGSSAAATALRPFLPGLLEGRNQRVVGTREVGDVVERLSRDRRRDEGGASM
jgi:hypothetical protein